MGPRKTTTNGSIGNEQEPQEEDVAVQAVQGAEEPQLPPALERLLDEKLEALFSRMQGALALGCGPAPGTPVVEGGRGPTPLISPVRPCGGASNSGEVVGHHDDTASSVETGVGMVSPQTSGVADYGFTSQPREPSPRGKGKGFEFSLPALRLSIPEFGGGRKESASGWLAIVRQGLDLVKLDDSSQRTVVASGFLRGPALTWYAQFCKGRDELDFEEFSEELKKVFTPRNHQALLRRKLDSLGQSGSVDQYVAEFKETMLEIEAMAQCDQVHYFCKGLSRQLRREVVTKLPKTLDEAIFLAQELDSFDLFTTSRGPTNDGQGRPQSRPREDGRTGGRPPKDLSHITCFTCGEQGHYATKCPTGVRTTRVIKGRATDTRQGIFQDSCVDGEDISKCLVDTGSTHSYIGAHYRGMFKRSLTGRTVKIQLMSGAEEEGEETIPLRTQVRGSSVMLKFFITKLDGLNAVLGMDWMEAAKAGIDPQTREVIFAETRAARSAASEIAGGDEPIDAESELIDEIFPGWDFKEAGQEAQDERIAGLLERHAKTFATSYDSLGSCNLRKHEILTEKKAPIFIPPRRKSTAERDAMAAEVSKMLQAGVIRPSRSPWSFPVVLATKSDGSKRFCVDYRELNKITIADQYPVANVDDILDRLQSSKIFSTLDLKCGYWQVQLEEDSIPKTAFSTPDGHYEFVRMPFGLRNAPADFSRLMREIFGNLPFVETYIDDLTVHSTTMEEHVEHLRQVFQLLTQYNLRLNKEKCHFGLKRVKVLGFIVGEGKVGQDPDKTSAISERTPPKDLSELRSFLGLSGYYRRFIKDYAKICVPFYRLMKKDTKFEWTEDCQHAFEMLKRKLTEQPVLKLADMGKGFVLHTDASGYAIGAVLAQEDDDGEHVVAYASRTLRGAEVNYGITDKECLAVVWAVSHFHVYLHGNPFEVVTDHAALTSMIEKQAATGRIARWIMLLRDYPMTIRYRKGSTHCNADAVSRPPQACRATIEEMTEGYEPWKDELLMGFLETMKLPSGCSRKQTNRVLRLAEQYQLEDGKLYRKTEEQRQRVPRLEERRDLVTNAHLLGHFGKATTMERLRDAGLWWPRMIKDVESAIAGCRVCARFNGMTPLEQAPRAMATSDIFDRIGIDLITNLPVTAEGHTGILVITEYFSKYPWAVPIFTKTAEETARHLLEYIAIFGSPKEILSDQGTEFVNQVVEHLTRTLGIVHRVTSAYNPRTNGQTERFNKTLVEMLSKYAEGNPEAWDKWIPFALMAYRSRKHSVTGFSPFEILFGKRMGIFTKADELKGEFDIGERAEELRNLLETTRPAVRTNTAAGKRKQARTQEGRSRIIPGLEVGSKVFVKVPMRINKLQRKFNGPFTISRITELGNYYLMNEEGKELEKAVPVTKLKPFGGTEKTDEPEVFEVAKIVDHRASNDRIEYFVKWAGFPESANTWEPEEHFNETDCINEYWERRTGVNEDVDLSERGDL